MKPVQRIFKYPLFLRRIYENTVTTHIDYNNIKLALDTFTHILDFINEHKRRKDLVNKYLLDSNNTDQSITGSIRKNLKKNRNKISNFMGINCERIMDEEFDRKVANFRLAEKLIQSFFDDLSDYSNSLKVSISNEKYNANKLVSLYCNVGI